MRGKELLIARHFDDARITPAYAGKRPWHMLVVICKWDHPRVCGEKYAQGTDKDGEVGSPPRMRGKVS